MAQRGVELYSPPPRCNILTADQASRPHYRPFAGRLGQWLGDYPLTKAGSFWINIPLVYVLLPLAGIISHFYGIEWGLWTAYFSALNAMAHVVMFFLFGFKYNPGLVASTFVNIPFGIYMVWYFLSNDLVSTGVNVASIIFGILAQASMMIYGFAYLVPKMKREGLKA